MISDFRMFDIALMPDEVSFVVRNYNAKKFLIETKEVTLFWGLIEYWSRTITSFFK